MIKAKFGSCSVCSLEETLLYRRNPPMCKKCYFKDKLNRKKKTVSKPKKRISPFSEKKLDELKKYRVVRDKYLKEHPMCEVEDCNNPSDNLHHKAGRNGSLLYDERYFLACCHLCHPQRIHENPQWAREKRYIITINNKE